MIEIRADGCLVKVVGYQHENNRAQIRFPLDDVRDMVYGSPGGTFALAYKRAFDDQFYTSTDVEVNDDYLIWTVGSHALAVRGDVEVQISYSTADAIAETQIFRFKVSKSIMEGTEGQGENLSDLIEQALTAAGGISAEIAAAETTLDAAVADAQAAQTAAETAQGAAETAQQEAETAKAGAEAAQEAAEGAQERAEAAEGNAAADAADAAQSASEGANSASAAALSASGAATSAAGAESDRIAAQGAKIAAEAAQAGAEAAQAAAETAVAGVETAGATQVAAVNAAGATQTGNVNTAGTTQVAAVNAAGAAVIESIPADYSELSADVSQVKNAINDSYHSIPNQSEASVVHENTQNVNGLTFIGNEQAFTTAKYANAKNVAPSMSYNNTKYGVTITGSNRFVTYNGTSDRNETILLSYVDFTPHLPAGTYKIVVYVDPGESNLVNKNQCPVVAYYDEGSTKKDVYVGSTNEETTITVTDTIRRIAISGGVINGSVYSNYKLWFGIFPNDAVITDTNHTVENGDEYEIAISGNYDAIDTMQHQSRVLYFANIKNYVDQHIPDDVLTEEDLVYVTPEMFESSRVSAGDDYAVINACLQYAIAHHVPVRGFGNYTISQGITIEVDDADIFINSLSTTMQSGSVVTLTGYRNRVNINKIYAENGNCVGFTLYGKYNHWTEFNTIILPYIFTKKDCIFIDCLNQTPGDAYVCTNKIYTQYIRSSNENCIHSINGYGENQFFGGGQVICPNGWAIYITNSGNKFYNFVLESYARSGVYCVGSNNYFTGFRIAELRGQKTDPESDVGTLIKFVGAYCFTNIFECADCINTIDIDVSDATSNEDLTSAQKELCQHINIIRGAGVRGRGYDASITNQGYYTLYGKEVITIRNKKIVTPYGLLQRDVSENIDYATNEYTSAYANWFTIKATSTITLNDSYCPIGFNEIYVDQTDAKVTVYKGGNVIFDGTQYDNKLYKLVCYCDMVNNVFNEKRPWSTTLMYDGENEVWKVLEV